MFDSWLDNRVCRLPNQIQVQDSHLDFDSFCLFNGFAEVLDQWHLTPQVSNIRNTPLLAKFVRAPNCGEGFYHAYFHIPSDFKRTYKTAYAQLMKYSEMDQKTLDPLEAARFLAMMLPDISARFSYFAPRVPSGVLVIGAWRPWYWKDYAVRPNNGRWHRR